MWFLLQFTGSESDLRLDLTDKPEFDHWRWVDFWYPLEHVVLFKRSVYASALRHLAPFARQIAGPQAIPQPSADAWSRPPADAPATVAGVRTGLGGSGRQTAGNPQRLIPANAAN